MNNHDLNLETCSFCLLVKDTTRFDANNPELITTNNMVQTHLRIAHGIKLSNIDP